MRHCKQVEESVSQSRGFWVESDS